MSPSANQNDDLQPAPAEPTPSGSQASSRQPGHVGPAAGGPQQAPGGYPGGYQQPPHAVPGAQIIQTRDPQSKSPALACVLSILPGLGQIYVGYYVRGFVHAIVVAVLFTLSIAMETNATQDLFPFVVLFMVFFWLYNIIDAGRKATLLNHALAGGESIQLPSDFVMPKFRGSIVAGSILIIGGFVLLLYTRFDVPLDWLEQWWPVLPMGLGVWLIFKAIQERLAERSE